MKRKFLIISIICLFLLPVISLAQSGDDILLEQIKGKETEIAKLEKEAQKFRDSLAQTQTQKKTLSNQLQIIQGQINQLQSELKITKAKISKTELNIKSFVSQISKKQKEINSRQKGIAQSLRALAYLDNENFVLTLLNNNFSDFLSQAQYVSNLQESLYSDFKLLTGARKNFENLKGAEEQKNAELSDLKKSLTVQNHCYAELPATGRKRICRYRRKQLQHRPRLLLSARHNKPQGLCHYEIYRHHYRNQ